MNYKILSSNKKERKYFTSFTNKYTFLALGFTRFNFASLNIICVIKFQCMWTCFKFLKNKLRLSLFRKRSRDKTYYAIFWKEPSKIKRNCCVFISNLEAAITINVTSKPNKFRGELFPKASSKHQIRWIVIV